MGTLRGKGLDVRKRIVSTALTAFVLVLLLPIQARALTFAGSSGSPFTVGTSPTSVALGDVNADGKLDVATANSASHDVTVLLGDDGLGGFTPAALSPFAVDASSPISIAFADVNGDGKLDIATANYGSSNVTILLGDGTGAFTPAALSPFGINADNPASLAFGDVNTDGNLDLVTANYAAAGSVSVLTGDGGGGFAATAGSPYAVDSTNTNSVALGDVNADGKLDLATSNYASDNVSVLIGAGTGDFTPAVGSPFAVDGLNLKSVALGDVNADGKLDLATANSASDNVSVLLGNGSGGFTPAAGSPFAAGSGPYSVAFGDMNADGRLDVAAANNGSPDAVTVLLGNGSGSFAHAAGSPLGLSGVSDPVFTALGDVNADGTLDTVTASYFTHNVTVLLNASVRKATPSTPDSVFTSQTVGTISPAKTVTVTSGTGLATHITKVTTGGDHPDDFVITGDHCTAEVLGDGYASTCTVGVRFAPTTTGARSATLEVISDSPASPETVTLSGTGASDTDAPETTITETQGDVTADQTPTFRFVSDEPNSTFSCRVDAAAFASCTSPFTSATLANGAHTFEVKATDAATNEDPSPATFSFTVNTSLGADTDPPQTTITETPGDVTNDATPTFRFVSDEPNSTFVCRVDAEAFAACTSPFTSSTLANGPHTFEVKATDAATNEDATPATFSFTVNTALGADTDPPQTTITETPGDVTNDATPTFRFVSDEPNSTFRCRVDAAAFATCMSPFTSATLANGAHTFEVKATDAFTNEDATPATFSFTVNTALGADTDPPQTTITEAPNNVTNDATPTFRFVSDEPNSTFKCRIDTDPFASCASPFTSTTLVNGPHSFEVKATDAFTNEDATPATSSFTVDDSVVGGPDNDPPETTITEAPDGVTADPTPTFRFVSDEPNSTFECRIDTDAFASCTSPFTSFTLSDGSHTFEVMASDAVSNEDASPDMVTFTVDATGPTTAIGTDPVEGSTVSSRRPSISFSSDDDDATYRCRLDGGSLSSCNSPFAPTSDLADGSHTFEVVGRDEFGNAGNTDSRTFFVDATGPTVIITGPDKVKTRTRVAVTFTLTSEVDATFECAINSASFTSCTDPHTTAKLRPGRYILHVRAIDTHGNTGPVTDKPFKIVKKA